MNTQIQNLNKQIQLSVEIDTLMAQSLKLMDIVNENQKRVNDIKKEQEQLQLHIDNSTDQTTDQLYTASEHMARND